MKKIGDLSIEKEQKDFVEYVKGGADTNYLQDLENGGVNENEDYFEEIANRDGFGDICNHGVLNLTNSLFELYKMEFQDQYNLNKENTKQKLINEIVEFLPASEIYENAESAFENWYGDYEKLNSENFTTGDLKIILKNYGDLTQVFKVKDQNYIGLSSDFEGNNLCGACLVDLNSPNCLSYVSCNSNDYKICENCGDLPNGNGVKKEHFEREMGEND